jgi:hypothetical protein
MTRLDKFSAKLILLAGYDGRAKCLPSFSTQIFYTEPEASTEPTSQKVQMANGKIASLSVVAYRTPCVE